MLNIKRPASRKIAIKFAALDCFLENGFSATTMADIRKRSGATTGSIYHFYAGKGALARELLEESLASWGDAIVRLTPSDAPRDRVRGQVFGLLHWARFEPGQFRFIAELRVLARVRPELADSAERLAEGERAAAALYAFWVRNGHVRPLPHAVARALMLGPAQDYAAGAGFAATDPSDDAHFADAAWAAVATP
ncbi:MAG: TetR/AcrR family transcriptional regulator [Alphaproteobacteria bacterium]|nr:TetR/AcrR family transcriptional regulator [Alphaproteobacteria bacterium]